MASDGRFGYAVPLPPQYPGRQCPMPGADHGNHDHYHGPFMQAPLQQYAGHNREPRYANPQPSFLPGFPSDAQAAHPVKQDDGGDVVAPGSPFSDTSTIQAMDVPHYPYQTSYPAGTQAHLPPQIQHADPAQAQLPNFEDTNISGRMDEREFENDHPHLVGDARATFDTYNHDTANFDMAKTSYCVAVRDAWERTDTCAVSPGPPDEVLLEAMQEMRLRRKRNDKDVEGNPMTCKETYRWKAWEVLWLSAEEAKDHERGQSEQTLRQDRAHVDPFRKVGVHFHDDLKERLHAYRSEIIIVQTYLRERAKATFPWHDGKLE